MQSKITRQCFIENCKNPLWKKNPIFALLCGHPVCRDCLLDIAQKQEEKNGWITHICQNCKKSNCFNFKIQDANHHLQAEYHHIQKEPKPILKGKLFTCEDHISAELTRHCQFDGDFFCLDCFEYHFEHDPKKNVTKHTEDSIK